MLNIVELNPDVLAGAVDVGGVVEGTRPGWGWAGGTAGENEAGVALSSFLSFANVSGLGGMMSGFSGNNRLEFTGTPAASSYAEGLFATAHGHLTRCPMKLWPV